MILEHIYGCVQPITYWFNRDCRKVIEDSRNRFLAEQKNLGSFPHGIGIIDSDLASVALFHRRYNTYYKNVGKTIELPVLWSPYLKHATSRQQTERGGERR